jgi:hypothetical protein
VLSPSGGRDDTLMVGSLSFSLAPLSPEPSERSERSSARGASSPGRADARPSIFGALASALLASLVAPAAAQADPKPALDDNHFALDVFQGPILAPIDVTAIAGAYAAYAEGIAGMVANAAAPAVREAGSVRTFELDGAVGISIPLNLFPNGNDFDNDGRTDYKYSNFIYATLGGLLRYGPVGAGVNAELQRYTLTDAQGQTTNVTVGKYHLLGATRLFGDQLVIGAGARFATLFLEAGPTLAMYGAAPEFGLLIRPDWQSFRVGATFRFAVDGGSLLGAATTDSDGVRRARALVLPEHVVLPWELELGAAVQVGPRPLNPEWLDPARQDAELAASFAGRRKRRRARIDAELATLVDLSERAQRNQQLEQQEAERAARDAAEEAKARRALEPGRRARAQNWPREHLLLTAELLVTGAVDAGVSILGFLGQNSLIERTGPLVGSSGARVNFSPRIGVEGEPVPGLMHTRFGSYYEPYRYAAGAGPGVGRQHFTFGADVKLFKTTWFGILPEVIYKVTASADLAPRYQSFSLGVGVWN